MNPLAIGAAAQAGKEVKEFVVTQQSRRDAKLAAESDGMKRFRERVRRVKIAVPIVLVLGTGLYFGSRYLSRKYRLKRLWREKDIFGSHANIAFRLVAALGTNSTFAGLIKNLEGVANFAGVDISGFGNAIFGFSTNRDQVLVALYMVKDKKMYRQIQKDYKLLTGTELSEDFARALDATTLTRAQVIISKLP